jgi:hypothetical protein
MDLRASSDVLGARKDVFRESNNFSAGRPFGLSPLIELALVKGRNNIAKSLGMWKDQTALCGNWLGDRNSMPGCGQIFLCLCSTTSISDHGFTHPHVRWAVHPGHRQESAADVSLHHVSPW